MADTDPIVSTTLPGGKAMPVAQPQQGGGMIPMAVMGGSGESDPVVSYGPAPAAATGRGPLGEIGTGLARGALVDLPTMAGQALQYATDQGSTTNTFAKGLVDSAAARGQSPGLTLNPNAHNGLTNALASGAEQVAPMFAPIAAVGGAVAAAPFEVPALAATGLGAVAGGALFGAQAGQDTLDKAQAKGVSPEAAQTASRLNAASTFATQVGLGLVGGKVLGVAGNALGKAVGTEAAPLAGQILDQMTGQAGIVKPFLKQTAIGAAEGVGLGATQAAASAGINNAYGVDDTDPLQAAKDSIVPMLGLTAVMAPFGLAGRALGARAAANRTAILGSEKSSPEVRTTLANQYAQALEAGGTPEAIAAGGEFRKNAAEAIQHNQPLQVDAGLFEQGAINHGVRADANTPAGETANLFGEPPQGPTDLAGTVPHGQPATPEATPEVTPQPGQKDLFSPQANLFPDTAEQQPLLDPNAPAGTNADLFGTAQPSGALDLFGNPVAAHPEATAPLDGATAQPGQKDLFDHQTSLLADTYEQSQSRQAAIDAITKATNPGPDMSAQDFINKVTGADNTGLTKQQAAKRQADARAAINEPSGVHVSDADTGVERELTMGELFDQRAQAAQATQAPAAPEAPRAPNEPKAAPEIASDISAINTANDFSTKPQALVPLQKQLDALGLDSMASHQEQIDALAAKLADPTAKIGSATKERMDALLNKWKSDQPQAEAADPIVAQQTSPEPAAAPAKVSTALSTKVTPTETADQVVNDDRPIAFHPKDYNEALGDAYAANAKLGGSDKPQYAVGPVMDKLKEIGVVDINGNTPHTHDEQITKLDAYLADKSNKMSPTLRGKLTEMSRQWKADMPYSDEAGRQQYVGELAEKATIPRPISPGSSIMIADKRESYLNNLRARAEADGDTHMVSTIDAAMPQARTRDSADSMAHMERSMMRGARQELDAAVANGRITQADAQRIAAGAQRTGNGIEAAFHVADQLDAPTKEAKALQGKAPKEVKALGENVPASVSTDAPAHADIHGTNVDSVEERRAKLAETQAALRAQRDGIAALGENVDQSPRSHAQETAGIVDTALKGLDARLSAGEKFTPLEQERYEDLQTYSARLAEINSGESSNEAYAQGISDMARDAATKPYTESLRRYKTDTPEATDPALLRDSLRTGKLGDTLDTIAKTSSTPEVRTYAEKLAALTPDTTLSYGPGADARVAGEYHPDQNHVSVYPGGESEQTILHEATHAATAAQITRAEQMGVPRTQADARLKAAYNELEAIRTAVAAKFPDATGLNNAHEFVAELNTNREFQQMLKDASAGQKTLWQRAVDAVKKLLGMQTQGDYLERAMAAQEPLFEHTQAPDEAGFPLREGTTLQRLFNKSPKDATTETDDQYSKLGKLGDKAGNGLDLSKISHAVYKALAGWKTVQYLADRVRAIPELVPFSKGVDAYLKAHESRKLAVAGLEDPMTAYAQKTRQMLDKLGDSDKARDMSRQMATIAGEASRGEFDFRMNYADNVKSSKQGGGGRELPAANKAYVDDIHRQFTQLQRTNPEAAKLIEEGERLNRKLLVTKVSTVARKLLDAAAGVAEKDKVRLQAEIARMAPDDAERAKLQTRVDAVTGVGELANQHALGLDFMDPALAKARNTDVAQWHDGASSTLDGRLGALFKAASALPPGTPLRSHLTELATMYGAQRNNPYFSLGRSGDYFVKVAFKNMDAATQAKLQDALKGTNKVLGNLLDGNDHAFFRVETADQAMGLMAKLSAAGGDKIDQSKSARGLLADKDMASATGVTPALRQLLDAVHTTVDNTGLAADSAAAMRDTITRQVLSMLPETSSRSATMQRRGIPGYDADFLGNFARRANGGAQDNANLYTQSAFTQSQKQMADATQQLARTGSIDMQTRAQMTADEINKRYSNSQKPIDNTIVNTLNSLGHTFYLAASPAYLIRTTAQPFHRALPILGARYGFVSAAREVGGATGTALKIMASTIKQGYSQGGMRGLLDTNMTFKNMGLNPKEEAFVQELHDRGILNLGQSRQLQQMSMGGTQRQQDLARMASMTAQYAEMTNRLSTGLAAFRLAEKATGTAQRGTEANTEWAIQTVDRAMDNFDPSNTARQISKNGFAGKVTPLLTAFMNYNLQTLQQISRTVHDGMFNQDQSPAGLQRSKEAKKEFAGLMATTFMISGAMGLPFANAFAGVYNTLTNDNDDPKDIRITAQNFLSDNLGHTLGGIVAHGLPHGAGFDSSTFGLENLLPGSEFLASRRLLKDRLADSSQQLIGPALNAGLNMVEAADKFSDGYYVKGLEAALPSGLKPYFKAAELAHNGYTDSKGNKIGIEASPWDVGLQAVGFNSAKRATQLEASAFQGARQDRQAFAHGQIADQFYKGAANDDPDTMADAGSALTQYNAKNPTQPIRDVSGGIRDRMMMLALSQASGTGVAVNRAAFPSLLHNLAYARDPDAAMPGY